MMKTLLVLALLSSLLIFGCTNTYNNSATGNSTNAQGPNNSENITKNSQEYAAAASACEKVTPPNIRNWCFSNLSILSRDATYCEKITPFNDLNQKDHCYDQLARLTMDSSLCDKIEQGTKDYCYENVSISKRDITICDKMSDSQLKGECYGWVAAAAGDLSICDKIAVSFYGTCYDVVAKKQYACGNEVMTNRSRDACYSRVAGAIGDESICEKINSPIKDDCYADMDYTKLTASMCNKIQNLDLRRVCYIRLAQYKQDTTVCDEIPDQANKDWCHYNFVIGLQIEYKSNPASFTDSTIANLNTSVCDVMTTPDPKNKCYWVISKMKKDLSICEKITEPFYKALCVD